MSRSTFINKTGGFVGGLVVELELVGKLVELELVGELVDVGKLELDVGGLDVELKERERESHEQMTSSFGQARGGSPLGGGSFLSFP
jgi:hypothetical protein